LLQYVQIQWSSFIIKGEVADPAWTKFSFSSNYAYLFFNSPTFLGHSYRESECVFWWDIFGIH